jgi:excisionase family DNA binding protein
LDTVAAPALLTVGKAAAVLRLSRATVWRRIHSGELRAVRLGGKGAPVRVPVTAIRELQRDYAEAAG